MKIDRILSGLRQTQDTTKEASVASAPKAPTHDSSRDALVGALNDALATDKVASEAASPVADVMKVAEELAGVEQDARIKEAQVMGAAFADAFVARLGVWQAKAAELNQAEPAKLAADSEMLAQAQHLGYAQTKEALEEQAKVAYAQGYNDTVGAIHQAASNEFLKGAAVMSYVLDAVRQG